jgi:hypothetical protein
MKAILIKKEGEYELYEIRSDRTFLIGSTNHSTKIMVYGKDAHLKLSKQNCDEIFGVVDVKKLSKSTYPGKINGQRRDAFISGFNKAMALNKDKQFTLEDIRMAIVYGERHRDMDAGKIPYQPFVEFIPSLEQPTEIEVEIEMEVSDLAFYENGNRYPLESNIPERFKYNPKLDSEGCLILKKINQL